MTATQIRFWACERFKDRLFGPRCCPECAKVYQRSYYRCRSVRSQKKVSESKARELLYSASANLRAALEYISSKCTDECPENCTEVAHADSEPDCEAAADEMMDAERKIKEYIALVEAAEAAHAKAQ